MPDIWDDDISWFTYYKAWITAYPPMTRLETSIMIWWSFKQIGLETQPYQRQYINLVVCFPMDFHQLFKIHLKTPNSQITAKVSHWVLTIVFSSIHLHTLQLCAYLALPHSLAPLVDIFFLSWQLGYGMFGWKGLGFTLNSSIENF